MNEYVIPHEHTLTLPVPAVEKYEARHRGSSRSERIARGMVKAIRQAPAATKEFVTRRVELSPEEREASLVGGIPDYYAAAFGEEVLTPHEANMTEYAQ